MAFLSNFDIAISGMVAQRLRLDVIAQNVTNATTTRTAEGGPYVRKNVVFTENKTLKNVNTKDGSSFKDVLSMSLSELQEKKYGGVLVTEIVEDPTPATPVYDPSHPDADEDGYYYLPNVDVEEEEIDALAATQSYDSCLTIFNSMKTLAQKALTIGS